MGNYFQALFNFPEDSSFWNKFAEQQKLFNEKYNALDPADLFEGLTYEGTNCTRFVIDFLIYFS